MYASAKNPFTPTFGRIPAQLVGRDLLLSDLFGALANGPGDPNLSTLISGAWGTGKTALMNYVASEAVGYGWVSSSVSAVPGMLEDLFQRALESADLSLSATRLSSFGLGPMNVSWNYTPGFEPNWRTRMNRLLDQLSERELGLLITVDEVKATLPDMVQLASIYQHFVGENRRVGLLMAGLPYDVSALLGNDDVSFLRRSVQHVLTNVSLADAELALRRTVEDAGRSISEEALRLAARCSGGYPHLMQLIGFRMWAVDVRSGEISKHDAEDGVRLARLDFERQVLAATYRDFSEKDIRFLESMLPDRGPSRLADIARRMGVGSNYASTYKSRLLGRGVIGERGAGRLGFELPYLRDYVERMRDERG